jgi:phosphoribosylanthranilate isomerase
MSLWIKICANTSLDDARLAVDAGADAVGFVFAPSPRQVTVAQVAVITPHLPDSVEKIGVFVDASLDEIEDAVRVCGLTGVQLHSDVGPDAPVFLRDRLSAKLHIIRVVHFGSCLAEEAASLVRDANVDSVLVDSRTATLLGGTGLTFDWQSASESVFRNGGLRQGRLIAAGGLDPANVAEAIATMRPWGVDVASGVEAAPGRKDPKKVTSFIVNARGASSSIETPK